MRSFLLGFLLVFSAWSQTAIIGEESLSSVQVPVTVVHLDQADGTNSSYALDFTASSINDLLLYTVTQPGDKDDPTTPSGFTLLASPSSGTDTFDAATFTYFKIADGTETTVTLTLNGSINSAAFALAVTNADSATPSFTDTTADASSFTMTGVTVPANGISVQIAGCRDDPNANTFALPGSVTALGTLGDSTKQEGLASYEDTVGATGNLVYSFGNFAHFSGTHIIFDPVP